MLKDVPVLEIEDYRCKILNYELLPISLRYPDVNYDDVMHGWTEKRTMNIGRTNAKKLLVGFRISQSNPYMIARLFHFASLSDCYWMKDAEETFTWEQVSLFENPWEKAVTSTALLGTNQTFSTLVQKVHTPEFTAQGMAAKAWIREADGLYLYKVGKKELPASGILDALHIPHVSYIEAENSSLEKIADRNHIDKIYKSGEKIVKCRIISSEETALVPWEDFQVYCSYHDKNEYDMVKEMDAANYYKMQIADYILGNEDRHGANFGFYMDNRSGKLQGLYPLMDHDHAFSEDGDILSQTSEQDETLQQAAYKAMNHAEVSFDNVLAMKKPEDLGDTQWKAVLGRCRELHQRMGMEEQLDEDMTSTTQEIDTLSM
ncbi:phosphatidylinositol 4-kinase, partial [Enterocloster bolteae]|uniref:phosphatidylinositol 4-kinase n=1 Tax=Enterocloster bolteae TaxID=208479 RepID=UPI001D135046